MLGHRLPVRHHDLSHEFRLNLGDTGFDRFEFRLDCQRQGTPALASGLFPVVSDIPANRPWVADTRTGLLFPPGDDARLADALERALCSPGLRTAAAAPGRALVERQGDLGRQADRLLAAFERIPARPSP